MPCVTQDDLENIALLNMTTQDDLQNIGLLNMTTQEELLMQCIDWYIVEAQVGVQQVASYLVNT